jgi:nitrate reductase NapE component
MAMVCGYCSFPVPPENWNREGVRCSGCSQAIQVLAFPALEKSRAGAAPESIAEDSEASCFYHAGSRAAAPCSVCGRFLCNLCDIELDGRHLCPACFQCGVSSNQLETMETRRTLYDTIALSVATFPVLLFWPAVVGAPSALYFVIRRWRAPLSILPRTRIRFVLAAVFAVAEIAAIVFVVWTLFQLPKPRVVSR